MNHFVINKKEKELLRLLFLERVCSESEDIAFLLKGADFDNERFEYLLMLAVLGKKQDWRYFPNEIKPRLEGIYKSVRLRNIYGVPWLKEKLLLLNKHAVPLMLLKGMAMRAYYAPETPRQMSDYDFAVPEERFKEAKDILMESDSTLQPGPVSQHALHIEKQGKVIDLHQWIFKTHGGVSAGLWENSIEIAFLGAGVRVLNPVDIFIHIVDCKTRDLIKNIQSDRKLKWLFDTRCIIKKAGYENWDWSKVADRAKELGSYNYVVYLMPYFSEVFPDTLSEADMRYFFPQDEEYQDWYKRVKKVSLVNEEFQAYIKNHCEDKFAWRRRLKALWRDWNHYHYYYGQELKAAGEKIGFFNYFCSVHRIKGITGLFKRVFVKLFH